ncbi:hypothetical protein BJX63DRAFT_430192 [Aspergillus granulosus]|uniref:Uncharacterized protein n=1 Tax=Aspergillus granulosus TaxID=176169 RepID=A0ABR4HLZ3_9EURO
MAPTRSTILSLSLALVARAQMTEQDWDAYDPCIDPMTLGTVSLNFEPLFPEPVNFTWDTTRAPDAKVAYWLEYNATHPPAASPHDTYKAMVLGSVTGVPSGGHNGCVGVLGEECADKFAGFIKGDIAGQVNRTEEMLPEALFVLRDEGMPESIGCSESAFPLFYRAINSDLGDGILAREDGESLDIIPSGNELLPFNTYVHQKTPYKSLILKVTIPVIVRVPSEGTPGGMSRISSDEESDEGDDEEETENTEDSESTEDTEDTEHTNEPPAPSDQSETDLSNESTSNGLSTEESSSKELTGEETDNASMGIMWSASLASVAGIVAMAKVLP